MSLLMGYNGGAGSGHGGGGGAGPGTGPAHGDLLYQDVALSPRATVHDHHHHPLGQVGGDPDHDHHRHHQHHHIEWHHHHLQDLHSPAYSMESDSAIGLSPSPDFSLGEGLSSSSNNNCVSSSSSGSSKPEDPAAALAVCGAAATADKKKSRRPRQQRRRTPPRHNIDVNDNSLYAVYEFFKSFLSASTASTVAIDNKIEQAMDLVKSHLMFAVREEVEVLKEKITELMERINQLEYENTVLKQYATNEALQQIQQHHNSNT